MAAGGRIVVAEAEDLPKATAEEAAAVRATMMKYMEEGDNTAAINYLNSIKIKFGTIVLDDMMPSLYNHLGVAFHNANMLKEAEMSFAKGVELFPKDVRTWINLGEVSVHSFHLDQAVAAFKSAVNQSDEKAIKDATYPRMLRSMGWSDLWEDWEEVTAYVEEFLMRCVDNPTCQGDSSGGFEYTNAPGHVNRILGERSPNARDSQFKISEVQVAKLWKSVDKGLDPTTGKRRRLKVGFVSSDFGVHPVSSLIRGMLQFLSQDYHDEIELYCFALKPDLSWWGKNVTNTVEHFVTLRSGNTQEAAAEIASHGVEVLIDLNGHTLHSGLPIMSHRPAPMQISFLGLPTTSSAPFIDYYIGDYQALPAEIVDHFKEKLILMPGVVIVNDYAQMQGDVLKYSSDKRAPRDKFKDIEKGLLDKATVLFGTLSNYSKISPLMFQVFTNILRSVGGSKMLFQKYNGWTSSVPHLQQYAPYFGLDDSRLVFAKQQPWIEHLYAKTSYDMFLDTITKGGHTTGLDGIWAGVPTVTVPGRNMPSRAGLSMAQTLGTDVGLTWSLKEFEDVSIAFARDSDKLKAWRKEVEDLRLTSELFDARLWTRRFVRLIEGAWESAILSHEAEPLKYGMGSGKEKMHKFKYNVFSAEGEFDVGYGKNSPRTVPLRAEQVFIEGGIANIAPDPLSISDTEDALDETETNALTFKQKRRQERMSKIYSPYTGKRRARPVTEEPFVNSPLPKDFFAANTPVLLNIGGMHKQRRDWVVVNAQQGYHNVTDGFDMDVRRQMFDLEGFPNNSAGSIYASHILEHASFGDGTLAQTLDEWHRVIHPGGVLFLSVPDLEVLSTMYLDTSMTLSQRWMITRMMYGAQVDQYDYHSMGFSEDIMAAFLTESGFCDVERVHSFNLFSDTSEMEYAGYRISLNMVARPCRHLKNVHVNDSFSVSHNATPFVRGHPIGHWPGQPPAKATGK
jgi:predicted SAM-dependent methyltransferase